MADTQLQKNTPIEQQSTQERVISTDFYKLLKKYGGFEAVKGFIPSISDLNPARPAPRNILLKDEDKREKREKLIQELTEWKNILSEDKKDVFEYQEYCEEQIAENTEQLGNNIDIALEATAPLERAYRSLDLFFQNAHSNRVNHLLLLNADDKDIKDIDYLNDTVEEVLASRSDDFSMEGSISLMVLPGCKLTTPSLRKAWATKAKDHFVLLITDTDRADSFESLLANTEEAKLGDPDPAFQNIVVTGNWIKGRDSEKMSETEKYEKAFFIPASGALAGKLYDESVTIGQAASGEKYGTFFGVDDVEIPLRVKQTEQLRALRIVPIIKMGNNVMPYYNCNLYTGADDLLQEYSVIRVREWVKKVLKHFAHRSIGENWDRYNSPDIIEGKIKEFFSQYKGYGKMFEDFTVAKPQQREDGTITIDVSIRHFKAANSFDIHVSKDKAGKVEVK